MHRAADHQRPAVDASGYVPSQSVAQLRKLEPATVQALLPTEIGSGDGIATSLNSSQAVGVVESSSVYTPTLAVLWAAGKARQTLPALHAGALDVNTALAPVLRNPAP